MFTFSLQKSSAYRSLNPGIRIILPIAITIIAFIFTNPFFLIGLIGVTFGVLYAGRVDRVTIVSYARMLVTIIPFVSLIWIFFSSSGELVYSFGFIQIYSFGLQMAGIMSLRFVTIILSIPMLLGTMTQEEFVIGLRKLKMPYTLSVVITMTFKLLPTMEADLEVIKQAQMSRGIEFEKIKMREKISNYILLFVPLLTLTINRMETLSKVIECRGVTYKTEKTFYKNIPFHRYDAITVLVILTAIVLSIVITRFL